MALVGSIISLIFLVDCCVSLNISLVPQSEYDDADNNCIDGSILIPLPVLLEVNKFALIDLLNINESAWIGGIRYKEGCTNTTDGDDNGKCSDIVFRRLPANSKLNYSCVHGHSEITVLLNSTESKPFNESKADCQKFGSTSRLPEINAKYLHFQLPEEMKTTGRGALWFGVVDNDQLNGRMARSCQFVTKVDECTIRIESGSCEMPTRKGVCYQDTGMLFHSTLEFYEFKEQTGNIFDDVINIEDESLCSATLYPEKRYAYTSETTERNALTTETTQQNVLTNATMELTDTTYSSTDGINFSTDSVKSNTAPEYTTTESTTFAQTASHSQGTTTEQRKPTTKDIETTTTTIPSTGKATVPPPKSRGTEDSSNNLWVIAVVLIFLILAAIVIAIIFRKRRRSWKLFSRNKKREETDTMELGDPVVEEGEPEEIGIIGVDLDDDNKIPSYSNADTMRRISVNSTYDKRSSADGDNNQESPADGDNNQESPADSNGDLNQKSSDGTNKNSLMFTDIPNENIDNTSDEVVTGV